MSRDASRSRRKRGRTRTRTAGSPSYIDQVFAILAKPWICAAGMLVLAGIHFAEAFRLLEGVGATWEVASARAVGAGLVLAGGLAMGAARIFPVLLSSALVEPEEAVAPDAAFDADELDYEGLGLRSRSPLILDGKLAAGGVLVLFAALAGYALWPLFQTPGLASGGTLFLTPNAPTEAAWVEREGLRVKENLGGWRFEVDQISPGGLQEGGEGLAQVKLRVTQVQSGETKEQTLFQGELLRTEEHTLRLRSIEPARQPAGVWVEVTDTQEKRTFDLKLTPRRAFADPAGPGRFQLQRMEENYLGGSGTAISGIVQMENGSPEEFWLFEQSPSFDAKHRKGRYHIKFKELVEGHRAIVQVGTPDPSNPIPGVIVLLSIGALLFFVQRNFNAALLEEGEEARVHISSLNDAGGAARESISLVWVDDEEEEQA